YEIVRCLEFRRVLFRSMSELMSRPVTTFTIGYEGKEDYNEFQFARRISRRYKTDHHEVLINRNEMQNFLPLLVRLQDEPIADNRSEERRGGKSGGSGWA